MEIIPICQILTFSSCYLTVYEWWNILGHMTCSNVWPQTQIRFVHCWLSVCVVKCACSWLRMWAKLSVLNLRLPVPRARKPIKTLVFFMIMLNQRFIYMVLAFMYFYMLIYIVWLCFYSIDLFYSLFPYCGCRAPNTVLNYTPTL